MRRPKDRDFPAFAVALGQEGSDPIVLHDGRVIRVDEYEASGHVGLMDADLADVAALPDHYGGFCRPDWVEGFIRYVGAFLERIAALVGAERPVTIADHVGAYEATAAWYDRYQVPFWVSETSNPRPVAGVYAALARSVEPERASR